MLRFYDLEAEEIVLSLQEERARAEQEATGRLEAEECIAELETELRRLRGQ